MKKKKHVEEAVNVAEEVHALAVEVAAENPKEESEQENIMEENQEVEEIQELVQEVTEETHEDVTEESEATEEATEEISEEAAETEESESTEEVPEEAAETEESEPTEEAVEEPALEEGAPVKKKKGWLIALIMIGVVLLVVAGVYLGFAKHYEDRFFLKTSVNGSDCAGLTVEEVDAMMQEQVEQYVLTVVARNNIREEIKASDIGIRYNGIDVIEDAFAEQNPYLWFVGLYEGEDIKAEVDFAYDEEKLNDVIVGLTCLKPENQEAPVSAKPIYQDGTYTIQDETYGTQLNAEQVKTAIVAAVENMEASVDLDKTGCYVNPVYTKESKEVVAARDALNQCLKANITYSMADIEVTVDAGMINAWISVDESMNLVIDAAKVRAFTNTLGSKYNTPDTTDQITTPTGKTTVVYGGRLGRIVNASAECDKLIGEIKAGTQTTREPILSQKATPDGVKSWGDTYIEVDIAAQHMWYIENGVVKFESDVVTGKPDGSHDTPVGKFQILEKLQNKVLRGNIMPNGKPEYVTPVKYWARVTWSGIGFHDATWQPGFGGELYKTIGSHGCINMPLSGIKTLYGMISQGTAVVIHY